MTSPCTSPGLSPDSPLDAEAVLERFERAWRHDTPPRIEDYLPAAAAIGEGKSDQRRALLEELVMLDLEYRWRRTAAENGLPKAPGPLGERPRLEEYAHCYPELGPPADLSGELIGAEYRVRRRWGDRPEPTEYAARFGQHSALRNGALDRIDAELAKELARDRTVPRVPKSSPVARPVPPPLTVPGLVDLLRHYQLLSPTQLDEVANQLQHAHSQARALAGALLQRGWLTVYQSNQLFFHNGQDLVLGPYVLMECLGEGGTGQVFKARHRHQRRTIALKVIRRELLADPEVVRRFYREVKVLTQLAHPNVVRAYDAGPVGETHFLEMEYVQGTDLAKLVRDSGPLPVSRVIDYTRQAALGLDHIHQNGLVHRDIKPHNLLLSFVPSPLSLASDKGQGTKDKGPIVKVLDLGLARFGLGGNGEAVAGNSFTPVGAVLVGTLDYMAPEQALDFHQADIRADIYSLGCTLYFLLAGQAPFSAGTMLQRLLQHQHDEPRAIEALRPDVPPELAAVLRQMLAKRPEDRFQTPGEAARALAPLVELAAAREQQQSIPLRAGPVSPEPPRWRRHPNGWRYALLATAGLVLLGMGAAFWIGRSQPRWTAARPPTATMRLRPGAVFIESEPLALLPGAPLSQNALVSRPAPVEGARSWTIETRGPRGAVQELAYSPNGRWLATASEDQVIRLWRPTGTTPLVRLLVGHEHLGQPNQRILLAWSPDSRYLASAGQADRTVRLWEVETGRPLRTLPLPGPAMGLAWSPDGRKLACGCQDQSAILLLDPSNGQRLGSLEGHRGSIGTLQWSPDGEVLASGSADRTIRLWDAVSGRTLQTFTGSTGFVTRLAWSPDGKTLASSAEADDAVRLWETASGKQLSTHRQPGGTADLAWAPDGKALALCNGSLYFWEPGSGLPPRNIPSGILPSAVSWSPNGKELAVGGLPRGSGRGVVEIRDAATSLLVQTFNGHRLWTTDQPVVWSPDGRFLAAVDYPLACVSLWDAANGQFLRILSGHTNQCLTAAWSPDGRTLATGSQDRDVRLWDVADGKVRKLSGHTGPVAALVWSPDGKALASGSSDRTVRIWDAVSGKDLHILSGHQGTVAVLAWSPDGKVLASGGGAADRSVRWWDPATGKALHQPLAHPGDLSALAWSVDGKWLAAAMGKTGTALVWDRATGRLAKTLPGQQTGTVALAWLADDTVLAATCADRKLRQWDVQSEQLLRTTELPHLGTLSPDRRTLAGLSWPLLQLWEADSARTTGAFLLLDREHWFSLAADGHRWTTTFPFPGQVGSPQWICATADGHCRPSASMDTELVIVVQTEHSQEMLAPTDFERKYRWKNDLKQVRLLMK